MSMIQSPLALALMQGTQQGEQLQPRKRNQGGMDDQTQRSIADMLRNLQQMYSGGMGGGMNMGGFQMSPQQQQQTGSGIGSILSMLLGGGGGMMGGGGGGAGGGGMAGMMMA